MSPGGADLILEGPPVPGDFEYLLYKLKRHWPQACVEAEDKPLEGLVHETFVYQGYVERMKWAKLGLVPETEGTMVHILEGHDSLTVVVDEPMEELVQGWLDELKAERG